MVLISFVQALGLTVYVSLVAVLIWQGNNWFGQLDTLLGPMLFLSLFVFSAAVCGLIFGGYPFWLVWEKKQTKKAALGAVHHRLAIRFDANFAGIYCL
ncbi:MAG: hypothetical protein Q7S31_00755 [bacterium]|nr:hypothetical protein [bacterium]